MPSPDPTTKSSLDRIESLIRRDPARRGLLSQEAERGPLFCNQLVPAAHDLVRRSPAHTVLIVTGFFVPEADPPAAETDGPLGAVRLAEALSNLGAFPRLVTDPLCRPCLESVARGPLPADSVITLPRNSDDRLPLMIADLPEPSHLIAIERVGPAHTLDSIRLNDPDHLPEFARSVSQRHRGRCHNMRGEIIDDYGLHRLFDWLPGRYPSLKTVGIGDGGNEIGMARATWSDLARRIEAPFPARLPCRIATDWTILAGTSNWGGYALAAAVSSIAGQAEPLAEWTFEAERVRLEHLVTEGKAVDGVTLRREPTVDGLPTATFLQPFEEIVRAVRKTT